MPSFSPVYEALIIGGGINGLSTLYHLLRRGLRRVALVERFRLGHDRGSSHGPSRITRSTYPDADYVRLMQVVHAEEWPRLERDLGITAIHPCAGCFFGPPCATFDACVEAVTAAGARVELLDLREARRRFPQFRFEGVQRVLHDHTGGVVAAAETMAALAKLARRGAVDLREETRVCGLDWSRSPIRVDTSRGRLEAERVVVTAGPWAAELLPELRPRLTVARQTVGYFVVPDGMEDYRLGRFPVWVYVAEGENGMFYGLPEFGRAGMKVARHVIGGRDDDPNQTPSGIDDGAINVLRQFVAAQFHAPGPELAGADHCLYTNTATADFIVDLHPDNPRLAVGAGFSGHGFKFGPLTGRVLAELVLDGRVAVPEFEAMRARFALGKHRR
jgi:sarcosine oxidase